VFKIVEHEVHKQDDRKYGDASINKLKNQTSKLQEEIDLVKKAVNEHANEKDYISDIRYQFKNKERILRELEKRKEQEKGKNVTIDFMKMDQYQFWKYID